MALFYSNHLLFGSAALICPRCESWRETRERRELMVVDWLTEKTCRIDDLSSTGDPIDSKKCVGVYRK